ncbi:MAG: hypothetical protein IT266_10440 [Saprospiraceae bacterium]|nr:hypothetical protein [Saprospiraceae bacterium]
MARQLFNAGKESGFRQLSYEEKMAWLNVQDPGKSPEVLKMRLDSFVFFDSTRLIHSIRGLYAYDLQQRNTFFELLILDEATKMWVGFINVYYRYDAANRIAETGSGEWNPATGKYDPQSRTFFEYNGAGYLVKDSSEFFSGSTWEKDEKTEYELTNGNVVRESEYSYDGQDWYFTYQTHYTYDAKGNLTREDVFYWDEFTQNWVSEDRTDYMYDASGHLLTQTKLSWDGTSSFVNEERILVDYHANGKPANRIFQLWDEVSSSWTNDEKMELSYDGNANPDRIRVLQWDDAAPGWVESSVFLTQYDAAFPKQRLILPLLDLFSALFQFDIFEDGAVRQVLLFEEKTPSGEWGNRNRITFHYSNHEVVRTENPQGEALEYWPNPATGSIFLESTLTGGNYHIWTSTGIPLRTDRVNANGQISLNGLPCGAHILQVVTNDGRSRTAVLIVH